jgi:hypothetical protein
MSLLKKTHVCSIIFAVLLLSLGSGCGGPAAVRVLFLGNSLTSANDLPGMLVQMARSKHHNMECDMYAPGGYTLKRHSGDKTALDKINKGKWNFVVLQEQSQYPAFVMEQLEKDVFPFAEKLSRSIKAASPKAHVVFYVTMAWKNGDTQNGTALPQVATYSGMQERIIDGYDNMTYDNYAMMAPVGSAWAIVRKERPDIELYSDSSHPNPAGTYLAACVFYHVMFIDSAVGLSHPASVDDGTASYLQMTADRACLENKWDWEK